MTTIPPPQTPPDGGGALHAQAGGPSAITRAVDQAPPRTFQPLAPGDCGSNDRPAVVSASLGASHTPLPSLAALNRVRPVLLPAAIGP